MTGFSSEVIAASSNPCSNRLWRLPTAEQLLSDAGKLEAVGTHALKTSRLDWTEQSSVALFYERDAWFSRARSVRF